MAWSQNCLTPDRMAAQLTPEEYEEAVYVAARYGVGDGRYDWFLTNILGGVLQNESLKASQLNPYHHEEEPTEEELAEKLRGYFGR